MTERGGDLVERRCAPCEGGRSPLSVAEAERLVAQLPGWRIDGDGIVRRFDLENYDRCVAFANAVAWIARSEDHHPDMELSYRVCAVRFTTHAAKGLTENDFICAAKVNALLFD